MDYRTCRVSSGFFLPNETGVWSFSGYADDRLALWLGHQWPQQCAVKGRLIAPEDVAIPHNLYLNASHYGVDIKKYPSQIGSFCFTPKDCEQYNELIGPQILLIWRRDKPTLLLLSIATAHTRAIGWSNSRGPA